MMRRIEVAERRRMKRTDEVQGWLSRVQAVETEARKLTRDSPQEIDKLCLGGYCTRNYKSSYRFGKQVAETLLVVRTLMGERAFDEVVVEIVEESIVADERPTEPLVVGLQSILEQVWSCLVQETAGIIGLYGMGGVGKTTLLTLLNNKFLNRPYGFDFVIWVVVSKDLQLEKIQETIGKKIGLFDGLWKNRSREEKALDIFKVLSKKKFVLLLDDLWERVDLTKVGVPVPNSRNVASKVVFTTRLLDVCGLMEAHKKFKVECLSDEDAWQLFREKVGEETLNYHHDIPELAQMVAKECGGLPLALITIGRAMAYKTTPEEWRYAIQVLRRAASEFAGLGKEVYPLLKFSYDSLFSDTIRSCLLYCSLYPEDYHISKSDLIDCWIGEGFLDENDRFEAQKQNQGYFTIGILVHACLLEEVEDDKVKMHDVIRDMTLWIACEVEKEKENFLVYAGAGLCKASTISGWVKIRRLSLMENHIEDLSNIYPRCPHLVTLFLNNNKLEVISSRFFHYMPSLKVLKLSHIQLTELPSRISKLVSLQHLDLSHTRIKELPGELEILVNLKCLNLNHTMYLSVIPRQLISKFSMLHVLRMFSSLYFKNSEVSGDGVLFARDELLVEELLGLKNLEVLEFTLTSSRVLQIFLTSNELRRCSQALFLDGLKNSKWIDASQLAELKHLNRLRIRDCEELEELTVDLRQSCVFNSLQKVQISLCSKLKDLTFLVFAPNVKSIEIRSCLAMEEIISVQKFADFPETVRNNLNPFAKLQHLELVCLRNLNSIYWKPLPFSQLKEMLVDDCYFLKKLPLDFNSAKERKIVIRGEEYWWRRLQWEDEATQNAFSPCFKSL
ncbi:probable disease resistance protein At5g63020 isoform X2 [Citrus sinensis]|uniref:probable disease resistance protein At5g63020 isoform X2 n=1 Tax=Citrus sinensis TaxID=2711 RepID=UPI002278EDF0|nr:probable disease resistance protein At5g63020 isoform X2 [Citrus sinensis]